MTILKRWALALAAVLAALACTRARSPDGSEAEGLVSLNAGITHCQSCDYQCMEKASNKAVKAQLECLAAAGRTLGPGWARTLSAAAQIVVHVNRARQEQHVLKDDSGEGIRSVTLSTFDIVQTIVTGTPTTTATPTAEPETPPSETPAADSPASIWLPPWLKQCRDDVRSQRAAFTESLTQAMTLAQSKSLTPAELGAMSQNVIQALNAALELTQTVSDCVPPGLDSPVLEDVSRFVGELQADLAQLSKNLATITAIATCGVSVVNGSIVLASNTACLAKDLDKLHDSRTALERQRQGILPVDGPATQPCVEAGRCDDAGSGAPSCNGEPLSCSSWAMGVWGEELRRRDSGLLTSRPTFCAQNCGNRGTGAAACSEAAPRLFGTGGAACNAVCKTAQCAAAIDRCVAYCCGQDGRCADKAHATMRDKGWN